MVEAYGDDDDDWIGKPVAIMRHQGEFRGKAYDNLTIAPLELWTDIVKGSGMTPKHRKPSGKTAAAEAPAPRRKTAKRARGR